MFDTESGPYKAWQKYGKAVEAANPRGLVVVSAHWENDADEYDVLGMSHFRPSSPLPSSFVIH
jgi:aromatic ring-opening dioxygenase catalytic subunit (LigB family)